MMYCRNCGHDWSWNSHDETGRDNICDACWEKREKDRKSKLYIRGYNAGIMDAHDYMKDELMTDTGDMVDSLLLKQPKP